MLRPLHFRCSRATKGQHTSGLLALLLANKPAVELLNRLYRQAQRSLDALRELTGRFWTHGVRTGVAACSRNADFFSIQSQRANNVAPSLLVIECMNKRRGSAFCRCGCLPTTGFVLLLRKKTRLLNRLTPIQ